MREELSSQSDRISACCLVLQKSSSSDFSVLLLMKIFKSSLAWAWTLQTILKLNFSSSLGTLQPLIVFGRLEMKSNFALFYERLMTAERSWIFEAIIQP